MVLVVNASVVRSLWFDSQYKEVFPFMIHAVIILFLIDIITILSQLKPFTMSATGTGGAANMLTVWAEHQSHGCSRGSQVGNFLCPSEGSTQKCHILPPT